MSFIQENIIKLNLNLSHEYKLIHFSDVHATNYRDTDSKETILEALRAEDTWYKQRTWFADKANEHYSKSHMIPSKECLKNLINYANEEKPTAVILSGDIIDYYSESNYLMLKEELEKLEYPFVFSCGNHETNPELFKDITHSDTGFMVLNFSEFKIISLDNSKKSITTNTLNNFKKELADEKPIIVSMHVPISTSYNKEEMKKYDPYFVIYEDDTDNITKEFIDILVQNDNIKTILCGHTHAHSETYFAKGKIQCCATSGLIGLVNKIIIK